MVRIATIAPEADDTGSAPAQTAYGIAAALVDGTHVAVAFPAAHDHVPVALDAGRAITTGEQRCARTLTRRLVAQRRSGAKRRATAS